MRIEPFEPSHLIGAVAHWKQERHQASLDPETILAGTAWSAFAEDSLVAVGGLIDTGEFIGAWILFTDRNTPGRFVAIYRELARRLTGLLKAGEAVLVHIDPDYPEAARLAERLGFQTDGRDVFDDGREMIRMVVNAKRIS